MEPVRLPRRGAAAPVALDVVGPWQCSRPRFDTPVEPGNTLFVDARQGSLDAQVAKAAEAWLNDPADVTGYGRLLAAVKKRRRWLDRAHRAPVSQGRGEEAQAPSGQGRGEEAPSSHGGEDAPRSHGRGEESRGHDGADAGSKDPDPSSDSTEKAADDEHVETRPAVRAVGADLVGDPVAVLRRLRGG